MSSVKNPVEKKRLAYQNDHYVRGGASPTNWRKVKRGKKAFANRSHRKRIKDLLPVCGDEESSPEASVRKFETIMRRTIYQMGAVSLKEFVVWRQRKRAEMIGARKLRRIKNDAVAAFR